MTQFNSMMSSNNNNNILGLNYPESIQRANVSLVRTAIDLNSNRGGSLVINANNLDYSESLILATIVAGETSNDSRGADIFIDATGEMSMNNNSFIISITCNVYTYTVERFCSHSGNILRIDVIMPEQNPINKYFTIILSDFVTVIYIIRFLYRFTIITLISHALK